MAPPKGKSGVAAILLRMDRKRDSERNDEYDTSRSHEKDAESDDEGSDDMDPGLEDAMDDFLQAQSDKDPKAMAEALCRFIHVHESCDRGEDDESED